MRRLPLALGFLLAAGSACGQHHHRTWGSPSGFGNILFPGVGTAPPLTLRPAPSFPSQLSATVRGVPPFGTAGRSGRRGGAAIGGGFIYPVLVGGYGYGYSYPPTPEVTVVSPPQPAQPPVIINQYFGVDASRALVREPATEESGLTVYQAPVPPPPAPVRKQAAEPDPKPTIYLLAFKDSRVYSALAFWVEDGTLHYITTGGNHNRASLELVDRDVSRQLNRERNVEFQLPQ